SSPPPYLPSPAPPGEQPSYVLFPGPLLSPAPAAGHPPAELHLFLLRPDFLDPATADFFGRGGASLSLAGGVLEFRGSTEGGEPVVYKLQASRGHIAAGAPVLVAALLTEASVWLSVAGAPLRQFDGGAPHAFERGAPTFLGGSEAGRAFKGGIGAYAAFPAAQRPSDVRAVLGGMAGRWGAEMLEEGEELVAGGEPGKEGAAEGKGADVERENPNPGELTPVQREELARKKLEEARLHSEAMSHKDEWLAAFDQIARQGDADAREETERAKAGAAAGLSVGMITGSEAAAFEAGPCEGAGDAFGGMPLQVWEAGGGGGYKQVMWPAPRTATLHDANEWREAYELGMGRIRTARVGGGELVGLVKREKRGMEEKRHELFCEP
ncbi:hypothetical protein TeGR_g10813, partial [Tetraparma gracilis]